MASDTRRSYDAFLPASACYQSLKDALTDYANAHGMSRADVVRQAVETFLQQPTRKVGKQRKKRA